jgi:hypothetical protein
VIWRGFSPKGPNHGLKWSFRWVNITLHAISPTGLRALTHPLEDRSRHITHDSVQSALFHPLSRVAVRHVTYIGPDSASPHPPAPETSVAPSLFQPLGTFAHTPKEVDFTRSYPLEHVISATINNSISNQLELTPSMESSQPYLLGNAYHPP